MVQQRSPDFDIIWGFVMLSCEAIPESEKTVGNKKPVLSRIETKESPSALPLSVYVYNRMSRSSLLLLAVAIGLALIVVDAKRVQTKCAQYAAHRSRKAMSHAVRGVSRTPANPGPGAILKNDHVRIGISAYGSLGARDAVESQGTVTRESTFVGLQYLDQQFVLSEFGPEPLIGDATADGTYTFIHAECRPLLSDPQITLYHDATFLQDACARPGVRQPCLTTTPMWKVLTRARTSWTFRYLRSPFTTLPSTTQQVNDGCC